MPCVPSCWQAPPPPRSAVGVPAVAPATSVCPWHVRSPRAHRDEQRAQVGVTPFAKVPHADLPAADRVRRHPGRSGGELPPRAQAFTSPSVAASAVEPSTPIPGTWSSSRAPFSPLLQRRELALKLVDALADLLERVPLPVHQHAHRPGPSTPPSVRRRPRAARRRRRPRLRAPPRTGRGRP